MKIKICNVHKMALANEGEERKPIHIPFGTWDYDETITQTLDKPHAEAIANELSRQIEAGEPGIPVYQGHPDVPEYAGKYPDKGALGWVKKIMVNEDGMDLFVDWDRDPGKGFGWFSPYWVGDRPTVGSGGKKNVIVDGLNSIGLVNNPNIREFRLANEAQLEERKTMKPYQLPQKIIDLANEYDESKHPRDEDGKWTSAPGGASAPKKPMEKTDSRRDPGYVTERRSRELASTIKDTAGQDRAARANHINRLLKFDREDVRSKDEGIATAAYNGRRESHKAAILLGLKYNRATHQYE